MAKILALVATGYHGKPLPHPSPDPLVIEDALLETTLLATIHFLAPSALGILFDLRTSFHFRGTENTALLIFRDVSHMTASSVSHQVWLVSGSRIVMGAQEYRVTFLDMLPNRSLEVKAKAVEFLTGYVPGISSVAASIEQKDYSDFLRTIPHWDSDMRVSTLSRLNFN